MSATNGTTSPNAGTEMQFIYLRELRAFLHAETGWIHTLTQTIQEGVAGSQTATEVGQIIADVAAPYRAEIARVRGLSVPPGCEAVDRTLRDETDAAEAYLVALQRWTAAGQVGITILRDTAGEDVHGALTAFVAARDAFQQAYTEAGRLLAEPSELTE